MGVFVHVYLLQVGSGAYSTVYLANRKDSPGTDYAIKVGYVILIRKNEWNCECDKTFLKRSAFCRVMTSLAYMPHLAGFSITRDKRW